MTTPRHGFGAHQDDPLLFCQLNTSIQMFSERRRLHVIRVAPEAGIPPPGVVRIGLGAPQTAEATHMRVADAIPAQGTRERVTVELRIVPRSGNRPHVDDPSNAVRLQESDEVLDRSR
jgi:hypothetical protein